MQRFAKFADIIACTIRMMYRKDALKFACTVRENAKRSR
ncbi:hypothetical protein QY97_01314 [Bacillus thermotolerans]|uniref:Uncharacterized protein n=1 Tax=Bacillus thermotolerans TaxID=1221996 RepID=A0A0F5HRW8_BACTR|nr:hypothetical protein QY95_03374 [Bacillus thermotolerans]KKB36046.1 hypothetical protein QY97_01314 [Bacillus thermotolerans]